MLNRLSALFLVTVISAAIQLSAATVDDILKLSQSGVGEEVLLAAVEQSTESYKLNSDTIIKLKEAGVSQKVIAAMLRRQPDQGTAQANVGNNVVAKIGVLNLENVDTQAWRYSVDTATRTLWIFPYTGEGAQFVNGQGGVSLSVPADLYEVRYTGESKGVPFQVQEDARTLLLLSRVESNDFEGLYISVFKDNTRQESGRLAILRTLPVKPKANFQYSVSASEEQAAQEQKQTEVRVIERERVVERPPSTTVIYSTPAPVYYYPAPVYYGPPCYPSYYGPRGAVGFGYGRYGRRSGWSVGLGFGF